MANLQDITLSVPDVSCEHCVKTINGALSPLAGVEAVETDIPTKSVHLRYDASQLSMEKIEEILDDAGYTISQTPAPTPAPVASPLTSSNFA